MRGHSIWVWHTQTGDTKKLVVRSIARLSCTRFPGAEERDDFNHLRADVRRELSELTTISSNSSSRHDGRCAR